MGARDFPSAPQEAINLPAYDEGLGSLGGARALGEPGGMAVGRAPQQHGHHGHPAGTGRDPGACWAHTAPQVRCSASPISCNLTAA